jgi:uncharacterized membrane protein YphA (DoxX/SURF4 family)
MKNEPTTHFSIGRGFLGAATMASGVLQLVVGDFVRLVPKLPAWVPAPSAWAYLAGAALVVIGLAIASGRMARPTASVLAVMLLVDLVFLYAPTLVATPGMDYPFLRGFMWTNPLKVLALVGGAALVVTRSRSDTPVLSALAQAVAKLEPLAVPFLALFLVVCGIQHFVYSEFVTTLVPTWMPAQSFWTYFTGVALTAGGVGLLVRSTARLAATLSSLMIFLWVLLLHIPRAFAGPNHANETAGAFEALALSGVALMVAAIGDRRSDH